MEARSFVAGSLSESQLSQSSREFRIIPNSSATLPATVRVTTSARPRPVIKLFHQQINCLRPWLEGSIQLSALLSLNRLATEAA